MSLSLEVTFKGSDKKLTKELSRAALAYRRFGGEEQNAIDRAVTIVERAQRCRDAGFNPGERRSPDQSAPRGAPEPRAVQHCIKAPVTD